MKKRSDTPVVLRDYKCVSDDGVVLRITRREAQRRRSAEQRSTPEGRAYANAAVRKYSRTLVGRARYAAKRAKRNALEKGAAALLSQDERARVVKIYAEAQRLTRETGEQYHVDHDRPLARGGKHHPDNLIVVPARFNLKKGAKYDSMWDFITS